MPGPLVRTERSNGTRIAITLFSCVLYCHGQIAGKPSQSGLRQPTLKEVLSWLPEDTASVIAANGPFPLPDLDALSGRHWKKGEVRPADLETWMRALPLRLLRLKNGDLQRNLIAKTVALVVEGVRRLGPPNWRKELHFQAYEIVVFDPKVTLDRDSFMKNAVGSAVRFQEIAGEKAAVFEEWRDMDLWTTFVSLPRSNVVLVANDADCLDTVLTRMGGSPGPRALPETLPEWKYVDTRAPLWGLRHYQEGEAGLDTSAFSGQNASTNVPDKLAVGLTFWFAPSVRRMAAVAYLSGNKNARQILLDRLSLADAKSASPREFQIRLSQPAAGVIKGSVTLSSYELFGRFFLGLIIMMGHAVDP